MDKFKQIIYGAYVTTHNQRLYGDLTIAKIEGDFPTLNHYFGKHLPKNKSARILEIGCGDGNLIYWLNKIGYTNAYGIDLSEEQVERGRKIGIKNLEVADLMAYLTNNTQKYDFIIARDVIEHFTRDEVFEILALVSKNLNDGGRFIMQVPNGQGLYYTSIFYGDYTHEMAYTISSVNQIILNTGFKSSACYPTGPVPKGVVSQIRNVLWKMKVAQLKFWKMVETGNPTGIFTQNIIAVIDK